MDLQAALRARLIANGAIGAFAATRVYWGIRPQNSPLPAIVLTKVAPGQSWTHAGPDALVNPWFQADYYAADQAGVAALAAAAQAELQRTEAVEAGGWTFIPPSILVAERWPGVEPLEDGAMPYRILHEYRLWARPS